MKILLVRHGSAQGSHPLGDAARGLASDGRRRFRELARDFAAHFSVERIVTSPLARAVQTAEILAAAAGVDEVIVRGELAGSPREILRLLDELPAGTALVGHNPSLSDVGRQMTGNSQLADLRPGGGFIVEKRDDAWTIVWSSAL